jgi:hypothetical protein
MEADIVFTGPLAADVEAEVGELFRDIGANVHVRSVPARRGWAEAQWLVLVTIPLEGFVRGLAAKTAEDVYGRLKALVSRLSRGTAEHADIRPVLVLQDQVTRLRIILEPDLPPAAYRQLLELDLSTFKHGPLHYDQHRSRWRSELDESE